LSKILQTAFSAILLTGIVLLKVLITINVIKVIILDHVI